MNKARVQLIDEKTGEVLEDVDVYTSSEAVSHKNTTVEEILNTYAQQISSLNEGNKQSETNKTDIKVIKDKIGTTELDKSITDAIKEVKGVADTNASELSKVNSQLSDKAKQTDLNATNKNVSANTTNLANHKAETIAYKTFATRDAQITGTQTIILPFTPKYVQIKANIDTTNYMSIGDTDGINHSCLFTFNSVNKFSASNSSDIVMHTGGADIVWGTVTFGDNSINITFSKSGTTVTGTIYMSILAMTH